MKFILASQNRHKLVEMQSILEKHGVEVVLQSDMGLKVDVEETGTTFAENAMLKAKAVMEASGLPAMQLGATVVFCDIDKDTLCIDPVDFEKRITPRTKAVVVVHYCSYPAPMDEIMAVARKHNIKVIEDVSHAQGGYYKGQMLGTFGDVAAMSLMSGKSFAIGEGGILVTNDREIYERAMLWGHYERSADITLPGLTEYKGLPAGGYKYRMHQLSSIVGLAQLKKYDKVIS